MSLTWDEMTMLYEWACLSKKQVLAGYLRGAQLRDHNGDWAGLAGKRIIKYCEILLAALDSGDGIPRPGMVS